MKMVSFVRAIIAISSLSVCVLACGSSGCCSRPPPPPVASCGGGSGCQPGYSCGPYGCARVRALSGITKRLDGVLVKDEEEEQAFNSVAEELKEGLVDVPDSLRYSNISIERLTNPNFIFHTCCEGRGLPDACLQKCHFNTYTADALEQMFHKDDDCPIETANEIQYCAAQGIDHTECCSNSGVGDTTAGDKCIKLCDQRPNRAELKFGKALAVENEETASVKPETKERAQEKMRYKYAYEKDSRRKTSSGSAGQDEVNV